MTFRHSKSCPGTTMVIADVLYRCHNGSNHSRLDSGTSRVCTPVTYFSSIELACHRLFPSIDLLSSRLGSFSWRHSVLPMETLPALLRCLRRVDTADVLYRCHNGNASTPIPSRNTSFVAPSGLHYRIKGQFEVTLYHVPAILIQNRRGGSL
ncbi:hypothetical protein J6590_054439 [Homalodisca vitripennis]|nr:hypothetical protein J6590_054439 [Homalodisca vitripennis]